MPHTKKPLGATCLLSLTKSFLSLTGHRQLSVFLGACALRLLDGRQIVQKIGSSAPDAAKRDSILVCRLPTDSRVGSKIP